MRRLAPGLLLVIAAAARVGYYLARPALSIDETSLSLDIGWHPFTGLLHPFPSLQTAPPLFLVTTKLATLIAGMNEYALRALPLVMGLLVPLFTWRVARRLLPEPMALVALALAAVAPTLVVYSVTVKPYIGDALFALLMIDLALAVLERPAAAGPWWRLAAGGFLAILMSTPAPFYLAAVVVALAPTLRTSRRLILCGVVWVATFIPVYVALYRPIAGSAYMGQFWGMTFFSPLDGQRWRFLGAALLQVLDARPAPLAAIAVATSCFVLGYGALARTSKPFAALLGLPVLAVLGASLMHRYPVSGRVLIFLAPTLILSVAAAVAWAHARSRAAGWALGILAITLLAGIDVTHPYRTPATRTAIAQLERRLTPGEPVYVSSAAGPAWGFYTTDWRAPDTAFLRRLAVTVALPGSPAFHNRASRGTPVGVTEGEDLVLQRGGRRELLGLAPGIQWRDGVGLGPVVRPDAGWAEREAERIRAVAAPTAWLLIANAYPQTVQDLYAALARAGATRVRESAVGGVRLVQVRFSTRAN